MISSVTLYYNLHCNSIYLIILFWKWRTCEFETFAFSLSARLNRNGQKLVQFKPWRFPRNRKNKATKTVASSTAYHFRRLLQIVLFLQHVWNVIIDIIIFQAVTSRQAKENNEGNNSSNHTCLEISAIHILPEKLVVMIRKRNNVAKNVFFFFAFVIRWD